MICESPIQLRNLFLNYSAVRCKCRPCLGSTVCLPVCFSSWLIGQSRFNSASCSTNQFYRYGHCLKNSSHWLNSASSVNTGSVIFGLRKILHQSIIKFRTIHFTTTRARVTRDGMHYINLTLTKIFVTYPVFNGHEILYITVTNWRPPNIKFYIFLDCILLCQLRLNYHIPSRTTLHSYTHKITIAQSEYDKYCITYRSKIPLCPNPLLKLRMNKGKHYSVCIWLCYKTYM